MPIHNGDFARNCVNQGLVYGVSPHFLLAVADFLSGIKDDIIADPAGDRIGPYRLKQSDWDAKLGDTLFDGALFPEDINSPMLQCQFVAVQTLHAQDDLVRSLNRFPSANELYAKWPATPAPVNGSLQPYLGNTRALVAPAVDAALAGMDEGPMTGNIDLSSIPAGSKRQHADLIVKAFQTAGYAAVHQITAVANAIAESNLNSNAVADTPKELSVGLFQLNIKGGLGSGHTEAELKDPSRNTQLIIAAANKIADFKAATDLHTAVSVFVRKIEQPANQAGEIIKRLVIAQRLVA